MRVDSLHPLIQIAVFDPVLLALLAFGFENEHLAADKPHEKIGTILPHHSLIQVGNFKAEVVVFDPGDDGLAIF